MKILLSIVIIYISFSPKSLKEIIKMIILFYLTSFIFGGAALAMIYIANCGKILIQNGLIIGNYTVFTIFLGSLMAILVLIISFKFIKSKISKKDLLCYITIKIDKSKVKTQAIIDTGNFLKEPITNIPVIITEHSLFYGIISNEILDNIENILGGDLKNLSNETKSQYISKLKIIPFSSLGKQNGMLLGLKVNNIEIEEDGKIKIIDKVIIGFYNKKLSKNGEYHALIGIDIL